LLSAGASTAFAQKAPDDLHGQGGDVMQKGPHGGMGQGMMGHGMMGRGMMGRGMMGFADTRAMRIAFILMDADGDGSLSVEEFRTGHDRIFKGLDANKDGRLTMEEIGAFMRGSDTGRAPRP
jgi:hypothetical protein